MNIGGKGAKDTIEAHMIHCVVYCVVHVKITIIILKYLKRNLACILVELCYHALVAVSLDIL